MPYQFVSRRKQIQIIVRLLETNTQRQQGLLQRLNDRSVGKPPVRKRHVQNHERERDWIGAAHARDLNVVECDRVIVDSRVHEEIRSD